VETVADFVGRTQGPAVPFVPDWYPWIYAHHYLRLEADELPSDLARGRTSLTETEARDTIQLWCALTGEGIEPAARALADAYLRRWGLAAAEVSEPASGEVATRVDRPAPGRLGAGRSRRIRRTNRRITVRRGRPAPGVLVPSGRRASSGS
jgi:hypothetical protein